MAPMQRNARSTTMNLSADVRSCFQQWQSPLFGRVVSTGSEAGSSGDVVSGDIAVVQRKPTVDEEEKVPARKACAIDAESLKPQLAHTEGICEDDWHHFDEHIFLPHESMMMEQWKKGGERPVPTSTSCSSEGPKIEKEHEKGPTVIQDEAGPEHYSLDFDWRVEETEHQQAAAWDRLNLAFTLGHLL